MLRGPRWRLPVSVACALAAAGACAHAGAAEGPGTTQPEIVAEPAREAPTPGAMPDDSDWARAPALELAQQDPHPGEPTPYRTEVRVLTDRLHLYLRVSSIDPDFGRRSVHT